MVFEGTASRNGGPRRARHGHARRSFEPTGLRSDRSATHCRTARWTKRQLSHSVRRGTHLLQVMAPPSWVTKSVTLDGDDVTDEPLEMAGKQSVAGLVIRMTDKLTQISGRVSDRRGQLLRDYVVVIQPAEAEGTDHRRAVDTDGPARILERKVETRGLRPGRYVATAIETIEPGRQFAPEFREQLRRGASEFSVGEGESVVLDLKLTLGSRSNRQDVARVAPGHGEKTPKETVYVHESSGCVSIAPRVPDNDGQLPPGLRAHHARRHRFPATVRPQHQRRRTSLATAASGASCCAAASCSHSTRRSATSRRPTS